jgi:hypothetical protein
MFFARVIRIAQSRPKSTTGRDVCILANPCSFWIYPICNQNEKRIKIVTTISILKVVNKLWWRTQYIISLPSKPTIDDIEESQDDNIVVSILPATESVVLLPDTTERRQ